eukprot:tig00000385_g24756.t1
MTHCTAVPARSAAGEGSAAYETCDPGFVPNAARSFCEPCPAGTYQAEDACTVCPSNTIASAPGNWQCEKCGDGFAAAIDSQSCIPCQGGYYRYEPMLECMPVPDGAAALPASGNYTACVPGEAPNAELTSCRACPKGTGEFGWRCRDCAGNTYAPEAGTAQCLACPPGQVASSDHQTCSPCPTGSSRSVNMSACQVGALRRLCPANTVAPDEGAGGACAPCPGGFTSSLDRQICRPCPPGYYRPSDGGAAQCLKCGGAGVSRSAGAASCDSCPPGQVPNENGAECKACPDGWFPDRETGKCRLCPPRTTAKSGEAACALCPAGHVSDAARTACRPCPPSQYLPLSGNATQCLTCPQNSVSSSPGSTECAKCGDGSVSDESGTSCVACAKGTARNSTQDRCMPCPSGFYAPSEASTSCLACQATQLPVATAEPVEVVDFRAIVAQSISRAFGLSPPGSSSSSGSTAAAARVRGRRLLQEQQTGFLARLTGTDAGVSYLTESVTLDTNSANVTRAEIKSEETAAGRLYAALALLAAAVGLLLALAGFALCFYVKLSSRFTSEAVMAQRRLRIRKLDVFYADVIRGQRAAIAEELAKEALAERAPLVPSSDGSCSASASANASVCAYPHEPPRLPSIPTSTADPDKGPTPSPEPGAGAEPAGTVLGAAFALVAVGLVAVAVGYAVLQFALANYKVIESLNVGASPSEAEIRGPFELSVSFVGFAGPCEVRRLSDAASTSTARNATADGAGVYIAVSGVAVAVDGAPAPTAEARYDAAQRSCLVTWRCDDCRLAASEAAVDFRLVSRLAFAVATSYLARVPNYAAVEGLVSPSAAGQFTVFRGVRPVTVPLALTPDSRDGLPRYDVALRPADNRAAERSEASFGLCSMTRPLWEPECAGEAVVFRLALRVSTTFLRVSRVERAGYLDTIADVASLAELAIQVGSTLVLAFFLVARRVPAWRRWLAKADKLKDGSARGESERKAKGHGKRGERRSSLPPSALSLDSVTVFELGPAASASLATATSMSTGEGEGGRTGAGTTGSLGLAPAARGRRLLSADSLLPPRASSGASNSNPACMAPSAPRPPSLPPPGLSSRPPHLSIVIKDGFEGAPWGPLPRRPAHASRSAPCSPPTEPLAAARGPQSLSPLSSWPPASPFTHQPIRSPSAIDLGSRSRPSSSNPTGPDGADRLSAVTGSLPRARSRSAGSADSAALRMRYGLGIGPGASLGVPSQPPPPPRGGRPTLPPHG